MFALSVLIPVLVVGAIAWGIVGVFQRRARESLTLATAASFYAHVLLMVGALIALAGVAILIKVGLAGIDLSYGYTQIVDTSAAYGPPSPETQRLQDLILATILTGLGVVVAVAHGFLARWLRGMEGGSPTWITRGTVIATTAVTGLTAVLSTAVGTYQVLSYFLLSQQNTGPFADAIGMAVVFLPTWLVALAVLVRSLRGPQPRAATA